VQDADGLLQALPGDGGRNLLERQVGGDQRHTQAAAD